MGTQRTSPQAGRDPVARQKKDRRFFQGVTFQVSTDHLTAAAHAGGCRRFIAQSYTGWPYARTRNWVKTEDDPLISTPEPGLRESLKAIVHIERTVLGDNRVEGFVLRYGSFYGPGTSLGLGGSLLEDIRQRRVPIVGKGTGYWSFVHIDDAAAATLAAVEGNTPGLYNIADDEPAPVSQWLPLQKFWELSLRGTFQRGADG